jgi:hypothetical protein
MNSSLSAPGTAGFFENILLVFVLYQQDIFWKKIPDNA